MSIQDAGNDGFFLRPWSSCITERSSGDFSSTAARFPRRGGVRGRGRGVRGRGGVLASSNDSSTHGSVRGQQ